MIDTSNTLSTPRKDFHRRRSIIKEFSLNTSTHGIPGIARSESIPNRIFWSIASLSFTGVMIYFIIQSIRAFFEYSTQSTVTVNSEWPQYFPAFSLCNGSPVRLDLIAERFVNFTRFFNLTNITDVRNMSEVQAGYINEFFQYQLNINRPVLDAFFSLSSMLISCRFNDVECNSADFIPFSSALYGICYTFNAKIKNGSADSIRYSHKYGGIGKLEVSLYTHSHQYMPYIREGTGIIAMIHDNTELPQIDVVGMKLAPGFNHKLTYSKKSLVSLPSPYSKCTSTVSRVMEAMFHTYNGADYAYSQDVCYIICLQAYSFDQCGCVSPSQWNARFVVSSETNEIIEAPVCARTDQCHRIAAERFLSNGTIQNAFCSQCTQQCSITTFNIRSSAFAGPSYWRMNSIKNFVENSSRIPLSDNWQNDWLNEIRMNYVAIEVIRETTLVESYTEEPSIKPVDLLSNVGGQSGLWIGMSFLSLVEFAEMIFRLIRSQLYLFYHRYFSSMNLDSLRRY